MSKKVLIAGINGMDGSHLADFLLDRGYHIYGIQKPDQSINENTTHLKNKITFLKGDLADQPSILKCLEESNPDEVYNLAGNSFLEDCWKNTESNANVTGLGTLRWLESIKTFNKKIKFFQPASSEIFGRITENPANENTSFCPKTQYGCSKLYGYWLCKNYRENYNMFICNGILFNHESERRKPVFVSRKITQGVAKIKLGLTDHISLGNIESKRDWGYAVDFVEAFWLMLQHHTPDDYVLSTGLLHSIKDLLNVSFNYVGIKDWEKYIKINKDFYRPAEVDVLIGNSTKAQNVLNWKPKTSFNEMVMKMVDNDLKIVYNK
jgi:GDPmannose 4,6-dehydratase